MPAMYALGQHKALVAVSERLLPTERLLAFHDDLYVLCGPPRVSDVHIALQQALWEHSRIQVHHGKTQLWNWGGEAPRGWRALTAARQVDPDGIVWRGDPELSPSEQGVKVLGTPLGHPEYVRAFLQKSTRTHRQLLERIPAIPDLQGAWLVLLFCAGSRANYLFRFLQSVRRTSRLNTTIPCEGASADYWVVTYLSTRNLSSGFFYSGVGNFLMQLQFLAPVELFLSS